jgi:poly-gamma-glutamate synthesis protein (capsule biosynthesis protein)
MLRALVARRRCIVCPLALALVLCLLALDPLGAAARRPPTVVITGDILLADRVVPFLQKKGPAALFSEVAPYLGSADLAIGNLECALATIGRPADKEYAFRGRPEAAQALVAAGFDLVALANNHSGDYGPEALLQTIAALRDAGLMTVGAGADLRAARRRVVVVRGSPPVRIAVLAFSNMLPTSFYASRMHAGTNPAYLGSVTRDIAQARAEADIVIALFHWGDELSQTPSANQRALAAAAADAGADLVVGHHPHVLQGLELRGRTLIAYSLGNFLFPSHRELTRETVVLRYQPRRSGQARVEFVPCVIEDFRPRLAPKRDRARILARLGDLSEALGARLLDDEGCLLLPARPSVDKPASAP